MCYWFFYNFFFYYLFLLVTCRCLLVLFFIFTTSISYFNSNETSSFPLKFFVLPALLQAVQCVSWFLFVVEIFFGANTKSNSVQRNTTLFCGQFLCGQPNTLYGYLLNGTTTWMKAALLLTLWKMMLQNFVAAIFITLGLLHFVAVFFKFFPFFIFFFESKEIFGFFFLINDQFYFHFKFQSKKKSSSCYYGTTSFHRKLFRIYCIFFRSNIFIDFMWKFWWFFFFFFIKLKRMQRTCTEYFFVFLFTWKFKLFFKCPANTIF